MLVTLGFFFRKSPMSVHHNGFCSFPLLSVICYLRTRVNRYFLSHGILPVQVGLVGTPQSTDSGLSYRWELTLGVSGSASLACVTRDDH